MAPNKMFGLKELALKASRKFFDWPKARKKFRPIFLRGGAGGGRTPPPPPSQWGQVGKRSPPPKGTLAIARVHEAVGSTKRRRKWGLSVVPFCRKKMRHKEAGGRAPDTSSGGSAAESTRPLPNKQAPDPTVHYRVHSQLET